MEAGTGSSAEARIYRADVVGSMLRPAWLIDARQQLRAGTMAPEHTRKSEDRAVTGGDLDSERGRRRCGHRREMRRDIFFDLFANGMSGFSRAVANSPLPGKRPEDAMEVQVPSPSRTRCRPRPSPALKEFLAARGRTRRPLKVTLPSPMLIGGSGSPEHSGAVYPDPLPFSPSRRSGARLGGELIRPPDALRPDRRSGVQRVYADARVRAEYESRGIDPARFKAEGAELLNYVARVSRPPERGSGCTYARATGPIVDREAAYGGHLPRGLKRADDFDVFHLEFDDERSGFVRTSRHLPG